MNNKFIILLLLVTLVGCTNDSVTNNNSISLQRTAPTFDLDNALILGDAGWHWIARLDSSEALFYLDTRKSQGFNAILCQLFVSDEYDAHIGVTTNAYGDPAFNDFFDWSTPNTDYWAYTDWLIEQATLRGFYLFITPAYVGYNCNGSGWATEMAAQTNTDMTNFGTWLATRYQNYDNIIWIGGGDWDIDVPVGPGNITNNCLTSAFPGLNSKMNSLMNAIASVMPNSYITAHTFRSSSTNFGNNRSSAFEAYNEPWLNMNASYSRSRNSAFECNRVFVQTPSWHTIHIEGMYEQETFSESGSPLLVRNQLYSAILAKNIGHIYGAGPSSSPPLTFIQAFWDFAGNWQANINMEGANDIIHAKNLFLTRFYGNDLVRIDNSLSGNITTVGSGGLTSNAEYVSVARNTSSSSYIFYIPPKVGRTYITVVMDNVTPNYVKAYWYNPRNGLATYIGNYVTVGTQDFTLPVSDEDWILVLDDVATPICPPGIYTCGKPGGGPNPQ